MSKPTDNQLKYAFRTLSLKRHIQGAEMLYFFVEGQEAYRHRLYIASATSLLTGIEASIRALHAYAVRGINDLEFKTSDTLSNRLLHKAKCAGINIDILALEGKDEFERKLATQKPNRIPVEVVRLRNNLCHGNVKEFFTHIEDEGYFFTPEALEPVCKQLLELIKPWADEISRFNNLLEEKYLHDD